MRVILLTQLLIGLISFLSLLLIARKTIFGPRKVIAVFFLFYFADNLAIALANHYPGLQIVSNEVWNGFLVLAWSGKIYSILITLVLLYALRPIISPGAAGVSLRLNKGSFLPSLGILLAIAAWSSFMGSLAPKGARSVPTLAYLAIMPGLNEELVYRGALPACLEKVFPRNWLLAGARLGWSTLIPVLLFGLLHGLWLDDDLHLHMEIVWIRNALISGFIFAWLRERTGSLVMPVACAWRLGLFPVSSQDGIGPEDVTFICHARPLAWLTAHNW